MGSSGESKEFPTFSEGRGSSSSKAEVGGGDIPLPSHEDAEMGIHRKRGREYVEEPEESVQGEQVEDPIEPEDNYVLEMEDLDEVIPAVLMLGERKKGRNASSRKGKYDVCELFSQPRVCARARARGLRGGWSLDLNHADSITGGKWDLSLERDQEKAIRMIRREKPLVLGLSPCCRLFSTLQNLRKTPVEAGEWEKAVECIKFAVRVAEIQMNAGRYFYFEHPLSASSWNLEDLVRLREIESVMVHMCQFGLGSWDDLGWGLVKKATRVITNLPSLASSINRRCNQDHRHVQLISGKAKDAANYTEAFCDSIIDGILVYYDWCDSLKFRRVCNHG